MTFRAAQVAPHDGIAGISLDWLTDGDERRAGLADLPSPFDDRHSGKRIADAVCELARPTADGRRSWLCLARGPQVPQ